MSNERDGRRELEDRLREVEANFVRQMRERGFEPAQAENIALPGPLARLYAEREELRAELEKLQPRHLKQQDSQN
jgi:hypothetical protein